MRSRKTRPRMPDRSRPSIVSALILCLVIASVGGCRSQGPRRTGLPGTSPMGGPSGSVLPSMKLPNGEISPPSMDWPGEGSARGDGSGAEAKLPQDVLDPGEIDWTEDCGGGSCGGGRTTSERIEAADEALDASVADYDEVLREAGRDAPQTPADRASPAGSGVGGGAPSSSDQDALESAASNGLPRPTSIDPEQDDDVVARQLREAAEAETDPELREKLWEEYRRYKEGL